MEAILSGNEIGGGGGGGGGMGGWVNRPRCTQALSGVGTAGHPPELTSAITMLSIAGSDVTDNTVRNSQGMVCGWGTHARLSHPQCHHHIAIRLGFYMHWLLINWPIRQLELISRWLVTMWLLWHRDEAGKTHEFSGLDDFTLIS